MDASYNHKKIKNPRETANPISAVTFFYTFTTFIKGFKRELIESDLYEPLNEHKSSYLGDKIERLWNIDLENTKKNKKSPSLGRVITKTFAKDYIVLAIVLLCSDIGVKLAQPILLGRLISFYAVTPNSESVIDKTEAYYYAGGVILCSLLVILLSHPYIMGVLHIGMKVRVAVCSLIYRKALKLSKSALGETTVGQLVNLLSNDVNRFDYVSIFVHHIWVAPLQTCIACYLMYQRVGVAAVVGVVFLLLFVPLQFILAKISSVYRLKTAIRTDERVRLMNEIILGIQVIKMYTWEKPFAKLVAFTRRFEIKSIQVGSYVKGITASFIMFTTRSALFITILVYILSGFNINAEQVFILTSFYNILRSSMTVFFPQGITSLAEVRVSLKRLTDFLLYDETDLEKTEAVLNNKIEAVTIKEATAKWNAKSSDTTFTNLSITVNKGSLVAIIGPVGSGKSSLIHLILKELPLLSGKLNVNGEISYASQEPWLFTGSVRQNILFGQEMQSIRYKTVVQKCSLERDFSLLPYGDKTIVGERGVSLSGGQRARINLARAIYKNSDIYLLDDPLSAVDTHVGKELFENCIKNYLSGKTVILVTHQLQFLKDVEQIIILDEGLVKAQGTFSELQQSGLNFAKLLESETQEEEQAEKIIKKQISVNRHNSITSTASTEGEEPKIVEEQRSSGTISAYVYSSYIKAGGNYFILFSFIVLLLAAQFCASFCDYFITYWVNMEQNKAMQEVLPESSTSNSYIEFSTQTAIYIYLGLTIGIIILAISRSIAFFTVCMTASKRLHDGMFQSLIRATMQFFNTNSSGRILNRFSKDIGAIDERLPLAMIDCTQIGLNTLAIVAMVAVVDVWLLLPTLVIGVLFYFIRIFYMSTSRAVKRLEGITRSPVFAHLNASLQGLTTVRAFGAQDILEKEFDNHQDLHSSAWYIYLSTSTAFGYWLDLICVIYITLVTLNFLVLNDDQYGGNVGLAITQSLGLTGMFQWFMRQTSELENQMTSVERVLEYSNLEQEPPLESLPNKKPTPTWPEKGEINFIKVFLRYCLKDPPVLKNLNFTIRPLEKVGIVGRTGAGKSSLIAALFQLTQTEGSILIDEIDTKSIGLHDLRSKISIIPQEPVLFSGTLRKNLDPFDNYEDEILWKALEDVELKDVVSDMTSGLDSKMSEGGTNFSVGQRQLVCLARAIIRNNKILILDEATANVDPQTDALIQQTIRRKFADCTVLTIAHRLNTVMDSDKVLVMDAGSMVEFEHPYILLQNSEGYFYKMVQQTGNSMSESLKKVAEKNYMDRCNVIK